MHSLIHLFLFKFLQVYKAFFLQNIQVYKSHQVVEKLQVIEEKLVIVTTINNTSQPLLHIIPLDIS